MIYKTLIRLVSLETFQVLRIEFSNRFGYCQMVQGISSQIEAENSVFTYFSDSCHR